MKSPNLCETLSFGVGPGSFIGMVGTLALATSPKNPQSWLTAHLGLLGTANLAIAAITTATVLLTARKKDLYAQPTAICSLFTGVIGLSVMFGVALALPAAAQTTLLKQWGFLILQASFSLGSMAYCALAPSKNSVLNETKIISGPTTNKTETGPMNI